MLPESLPICKPIGTLTVSKEVLEGVTVLNSESSANFSLLAVLAINEPPISNRAFLPKTMPDGLIKNRLALPLVRISPSILDIDCPVTRLIIFLICGALLN